MRSNVVSGLTVTVAVSYKVADSRRLGGQTLELFCYPSFLAEPGQLAEAVESHAP